MVKSILVMALVMMPLSLKADLFDFGSEKGVQASKIPALLAKLKSLDVKADPTFEENFNLTVKAIENAVEEEKLFCSGEATNLEGKTLPPAQKQLCMRGLKKHYTEAMDSIFEKKKKYLSYIHERQLEKLTEIQKKLRQGIEKNF